MPTAEEYYRGVTLLVTHYNRSSSLERLLRSYKELNCRFEAVVVSDDGSKPEHQAVLKELQAQYGFELVTTPQNKGLGNNLNKGQDAVKTPYTLYVQEDFVPKPAFKQHFADALAIMQQEQDLDIVRFYAYFKYSYLQPYKKGFSRMIFKVEPWYTDHLKFYVYSDHPHLRRSNFFEKFGRYVEGKKGDTTEFSMCISFIRNKGKGLFFDNCYDIFDQRNTSDEPSTMSRPDWKQQKSPLVLMLRWMFLKYRFAKNYYQLFTH